MNTWDIVRLMAEQETATSGTGNRVFNATISSKQEKTIFIDDGMRDCDPATDCQTAHHVQSYRTYSGEYEESHALTDMIIFDVRTRDTLGFFDGSLDSENSHQHNIKIKIQEPDGTIHKFNATGVDSAATNGWQVTDPFLIKMPGKYKMWFYSSESPCCNPSKAWKSLGSFVARKPHTDCFTLNREYGDDIGLCGDCYEGFKEDLVSGACLPITTTTITTQSGGATPVTTDTSPSPLPFFIAGGLLLVALRAKKKKKGQ